MKKSLVALAVLGAFAGVASAQSSVTLYGLLDVGLNRFDPKASGVPSTTAMVTGVQSGSRVGLRGAEDLGGGLRAIFNLEHGLNNDDGTQAQGRMWGRQAWAGFAGDFGQFTAGRQLIIGSQFMYAVDPFGGGFRNAGLQATMGSVITFRANNTLLYITPNMGGFSAGLGYSLSPLVQEIPGGSDVNNRTITAGVRFSGGPFYGTVTYESVAFNGPDQKHLQVGATYDFKVVKLHGAFAQEKDQRAGVVNPTLFGPTGLGNKAKSWMAGVTVPFGSTMLMASWQNRDFDAASLNDGRVYSVGLTHALSRRTNLYAVFIDADQKNVSGASDFKDLTIGVRHLF
jgi:predicted porin